MYACVLVCLYACEARALRERIRLPGLLYTHARGLLTRGMVVSGARVRDITYKLASLALPSLQHTHAQIHLSYVTSFTGAGGGADGTGVGLSRDRPHKRSPAVLSY